MSNVASGGRVSRRESVRTGMTLIEVLGAMSVLLVLAISSVSIVTLIGDVGDRFTSSRQARMSTERLAIQFRNDIRSADEITSADGDWPFEMKTAGTAVVYQWDPSTATIRRSSESAVSSAGTGTPDREDRFVLQDDFAPKVTQQKDRVTLALGKTASGIPWTVEASRK